MAIVVQKHKAITQVYNYLAHSIYAFISTVYGYQFLIFNSALTANRMSVKNR